MDDYLDKILDRAEYDSDYVGEPKEIINLFAVAIRAIEAKEQARIKHLSGHWETDEITCSCGYQSQATDYYKATANLQKHLTKADRDFSKNKMKIIQDYKDAIFAIEEFSKKLPDRN